MCLLYRRIRPVEQRSGLSVARFRIVAPAGVPEQPADLAEDPGRSDAVARFAIPLENLVVVLMSDLAATGRAIEIGDPLAQFQPERRSIDVGQSRQRLLVEAKRVIIGVNQSCPVAGLPKVARSLFAPRAETEMMAKHGQILKPFRIFADQAFDGDSDLPVQVAAPLVEQILINHVLQKRLRKSV